MDFIFDSSLTLYLPLYERDGASFWSRDKHGHLCTVTGALWTPHGRSFDGIDDYISLSADQFLNGLSAFTILAWIKTSAAGAQGILTNYRGTNGIIFATGYVSAGKLTARLRSTAGGVTTIESAATISTDNWEYVGFTFNKPDMALWVKANQDGSGTWNNTAVTLVNNYVGARDEAPNDLFFNGSIGEVWCYNRALTPLEMQYNYLTTKWRYR